MSEPAIVRPVVHFENPWKEAIPVPIEEIAECVAGGTIRTPEGVVAYTAAHVLETWRRFGEELDGYILVGGEPPTVSVGVRHGKDGHQYLSPIARTRKGPGP